MSQVKMMTCMMCTCAGHGPSERAHGLWPGRQDGLQRPHVTVFSAHAEGSQKFYTLCFFDISVVMFKPCSSNW